MNYDFSPLRARLKEIETWLSGEYAGVRTGRATPALLDGVRVESYGTLMPLNQIGSVSVEDPRTLRITPWDTSQIKAIEKAITDAALGVSAAADDRGLRIAFPELTGERRAQLQKLIKGKLEEARISVRKERDKVWNDVQAKVKDGELTEDDKYGLKDELQKVIDAANSALEAVHAKKEVELAG